ncbi:GNAT family N-acetyltransferase [Breoghania sp. L-A4]|uniref:GNAT family N-acetyltransferase n=1 Tax=Breoghania sp. L-A4 TaxID=2304600 RepID=UPI0020C17A95|nr:GNAT family N-acetyltransferase [Breoghania sp. L-A4]
MDRDPLVTRFVLGPWNDEDAHRAFVVERTRGPYPAGLGYWSVFRGIGDAAFLGWILLIPEDTVGPEVEIGWRLERSAWGQGFATEAARPVIAHAFTQLALTRIVAGINPANTASIRVAEKLGLRAAAMTRRADTPHLRYTLSREDFERASR